MPRKPSPNILGLFFSLQWWWTTLLVIAALAVLVRLGIWQLDRLEQRREFNAHFQSQIDAGVLDLNTYDGASPLEEMEYRQVMVRGMYDHAHEVVIRNQAWNGQPGYTLLTPMRLAGSNQIVLVQRGWVPFDALKEGDLTAYQTQGEVEVHGIIRAARERTDFGAPIDPTPIPGEVRQAWNLVNIPMISRQLPYSVLPVYVQRGPEADFPERLNDWPREMLPFPALPELEITEGPHLGYAVQWFLFAVILAVGYPIFMVRESAQRVPGQNETRQAPEQPSGEAAVSNIHADEPPEAVREPNQKSSDASETRTGSDV